MSAMWSLPKKVPTILVFRDADAARYWEACTVGSQLFVRSAKIGPRGLPAVRVADFDSEEEATAALESRRSRMLKKGYREIDSGSFSSWLHGEEPGKPNDKESRHRPFIHRPLDRETREETRNFANNVEKCLRKAKEEIKSALPDDGAGKCLGEIDLLLNSITPIYQPRLSHRVPNRKTAFGQIGGSFYRNGTHPTPRSLGEPCAPLVQLNLGAISRKTALKVGKGLLQVWMSTQTWGKGADTICRHIAPEQLNRSGAWPKDAESPSRYPWEAELPERDWSVVYDELTRDSEYEELKCAMHYWGGAWGFDWSNSGLLESGRSQPPIYITDWQSAGCNIPSMGLIEILVDQCEDSPGRSGQVLGSALESILNSYPGELQHLPDRVGICLGLWPDDVQFLEWAGEASQSFIGGMQPLLLFDGPLAAADPVEDSHYVAYRRLESGSLEFKSTAHRWTY